MPELPEVETTRRGIQSHVIGQTVVKVIVRDPRLRWPVSPVLATKLRGEIITNVRRRAKYLLLDTKKGSVILHLGMSGSLRILSHTEPAAKHDHLDIVFANHSCLRLRDPRRFGTVLWSDEDPLMHKLLVSLGPEPFDETFDGGYLYQRSRGKKIAVKLFIMDSKVVVGVGNIYANEALFAAGIHPSRPAGKISKQRYQLLAKTIKKVLSAAIEQGGTSLRDFVASDGRPGYFQQKLTVYGRENELCVQCSQPIRLIRLGQRSTFYCPHCQH